MNGLYSLQIERHVLGGLIRHQDVFAEIDAFVSEKDFFNDVHYTIFSVIKNCVYNQKKIDKVLLANQIKDLGVPQANALPQSTTTQPDELSLS